ncbi:cysteine peptidase family C39 domain-containing protein, partial [Photobacterium sp. MCCC 1A19761]|uniref:cysteine peptidase family C39 domain-containing protein n=1 Tax=Photobacterium sp. MCCC 1A19761 TaxID=3115000 RepID=UPI00307D6AFB
MAPENFRAQYTFHPFYQCLNKLGIEADHTTLQNLAIEPTIRMDDCIARLLDQQGIPYSAVAVYDETSLGLLTPPCLLHWNLNHFVVVTDIDQAGIRVWDPYLGECQYSCMEFMELCRKPGYVNCAISLAPAPRKPQPDTSEPLTRLLEQEKSEERILIKWLTPIAYALSYFGKPATRFTLHRLVGLWDMLARPRIFSGPQRNFQQLLCLEPEQARRKARQNIAELAINMGYTGFLLHKLKTPRTTAWADRVVATPLSEQSAAFEGQCIVELMHVFDPISTVYSAIKQLPPDRNFVV